MFIKYLSIIHLREVGIPKGIWTPVTAVKGRCPRPLDDGDPVLFLHFNQSNQTICVGTNSSFYT